MGADRLYEIWMEKRKKKSNEFGTRPKDAGETGGQGRRAQQAC
jgi:hypothetical protein